ncbi:hypothetical protein [Luteibacter sp. dw_328]|uniref:SseB family protein n=1 Tax=Luteibacter sp. dw_328 TaxID=2719796 RepID=UPI001BD29FBC|nr:hypothetical protein [Luteibacter sp. dw_328]
MELLGFDPENELERDIARAKEGKLSVEDLLKRIAESQVYVSSREEVKQDGSGFDPLLVGEPGSPLVAAFSSLSRPGLHRKMAEYVLQIKGRDFFRRLPPGYGVAVNPGYIAQLIISADAISGLKGV